jgi:hypothetical protein
MTSAPCRADHDFLLKSAPPHAGGPLKTNVRNVSNIGKINNIGNDVGNVGTDGTDGGSGGGAFVTPHF